MRTLRTTFPHGKEGGEGACFFGQDLLGWLLASFLFFSSSILSAQDGEKLFRSNCASCHKTTKEKLVGPGLEGVTDRRDMDWLLEWTKNSQAMVEEGDKQAVKLYEEYNQQVMPAQDLMEEEIRAIYEFVESGGTEKKTSAEEGGKKKGEAGGKARAEAPLAISSKVTLYWFALMALLIVLPAILAVDRGLKILKEERAKSW
jgi:mono/diheme cytochrome c family protein